jgi:hypothetical protein
MNTTTTPPRSLADATAALGDLIEQGTRLSLDMLESLRTTSTSMMSEMMSPSTLSSLMPNMKTMIAPLTNSSCRIPPPCWAPQPIGEVACHVCPGGTAIVRLRITNCGASQRDVKVEAAGKIPGVKITPPNVALDPMERDYVTAALAVPADAAMGQEYEVLLWVRGCQNHYLRWTVKVASRGASCCHEVEVEDCPDLVHHWYDHFYCERPCTH